MGLLDRLFRRTRPPASHRRSADAATGGRRGSSFAALGSTEPETLAAAGPIRSRARHAYANNGYTANGIGAIVAETVGAGIEANSADPDPEVRRAIDAAFLAWAETADAEGRTDLRGLTAAMVRAELVDAEAFALIEEGPDGVKLRQLPAEFVDEADTRDLAGGGYVVAGIEFNAAGEHVANHVRPSDRPTSIRPPARRSACRPRTCCTSPARSGRDRCAASVRSRRS